MTIGLESNCLRQPQWKEECSVVGIWAPGESVAGLCYLALFALQHRGQESAGIAVTNGMHIDLEKGMGLMREAFKYRAPTLNGHSAVGHVRYSTFGASNFANIQPILAYHPGGIICMAHNGSLSNAPTIQKRLENEGCAFQTSTDTEVILNLIVRSKEAGGRPEHCPAAAGSAITEPAAARGPGRGMDGFEEKVLEALRQVEGAYSLTIMTGNMLIGARDPLGFRPLALGRTASGGYVLASETCALDAVSAEFVRDIEPGEMIIIDANGVRSRVIEKRSRQALCVFEYVYFARPDSIFDGLSVWQARYRMGRQLAREFKGEVDIVAPVPDTGIAAALGFAAESGLPYVEGLIKNRYVGRTFIMPDQDSRRSTVDMKLNPVKANLKGKRVALVDDSLVRGTTSAHLISLIRKAGAKEVHFCISSPPITHPCYYGIDTAIKKDLIASSKNVEEIRRILEADGLLYLSRQGLMEAVFDPEEKRMCTACFSGEYPTAIEDVADAGNKRKGCGC